ncbi:MAG TPA: DoxX family protein [Cyclobacteriaceae bacterium]|nr:DoxX family protein [Cyclobacteriaceae bacterium]
MESNTKQSKAASWSGWILTGLVVLFLLVDAIMKVFEATVSMEGSIQLGWPPELVQAIGIVLLIATIIYMIPRTAAFGAILITGYLGGATSIMLRAGVPWFFPFIFGVLVWVGLGLRDAKTRAYFFG